jgi:hypothetical protein
LHVCKDFLEVANTVLFAGTFEARYPSQQGGVALSLLWKVGF